MRETSRLVTKITWRHSPQITAAFRRLRKEGYRCKKNVDYFGEGDFLSRDKFVFYRKPKASRIWNTREFMWNGDIEVISAIFESEGLRIGYISIPQGRNTKFFCVLQVNIKTGVIN
jgi:hypothetical protein